MLLLLLASGAAWGEDSPNALLPGPLSLATDWVCAAGYVSEGHGKPTREGTIETQKTTLARAKYWCATTSGCRGFSFSQPLDTIDLDTELHVYFFSDEVSLLTADPNWTAFEKCEGVLPRTGSGWTHDCPVPTPSPSPPSPLPPLPPTDRLPEPSRAPTKGPTIAPTLPPKFCYRGHSEYVCHPKDEKVLRSLAEKINCCFNPPCGPDTYDLHDEVCEALAAATGTTGTDGSTTGDSGQLDDSLLGSPDATSADPWAEADELGNEADPDSDSDRETDNEGLAGPDVEGAADNEGLSSSDVDLAGLDTDSGDPEAGGSEESSSSGDETDQEEEDPFADMLTDVYEDETGGGDAEPAVGVIASSVVASEAGEGTGDSASDADSEMEMVCTDDRRPRVGTRCYQLDSYYCDPSAEEEGEGRLRPTLLTMLMLLALRLVMEFGFWLMSGGQYRYRRDRGSIIAKCAKEVAMLACMVLMAVMVPALWSVTPLAAGGGNGDGDGDDGYAYRYPFEFLHVYLFFVAIFHCCACAVAAVAAVYANRRWQAYDEMSRDEVLRAAEVKCESLWWPHCAAFRQLQYCVTRAEFLRVRDLEPSFDFPRYLQHYFALDLAALGTFRLRCWLWLMGLLLLAYLLADFISCFTVALIGVLGFLVALFALLESYFMLYRLAQRGGYAGKHALRALFATLQKEALARASKHSVLEEASIRMQEAESMMGMGGSGKLGSGVGRGGVSVPIEMIERQLHESYLSTDPRQLEEAGRIMRAQQRQQARQQQRWLNESQQREQRDREMMAATANGIRIQSSASASASSVAIASTVPEALMWRPDTWFASGTVVSSGLQLQIKAETEATASRYSFQEQARQMAEVEEQEEEETLPPVVPQTLPRREEPASTEMSSILQDTSVNMTREDAVENAVEVFHIHPWLFAFDGGLALLCFFWCLYMALLISIFFSPCICTSGLGSMQVYLLLLLGLLFLLVILPRLVRNCALLFAAMSHSHDRDDERWLESWQYRRHQRLHAEVMAQLVSEEEFAHGVGLKLRMVDIARLYGGGQGQGAQGQSRISRGRFVAGIESMHVRLSSADLAKVLQLLDPDERGYIERDDLYEFIASGQTTGTSGGGSGGGRGRGSGTSRKKRFDRYTQEVEFQMRGLSDAVGRLNSALHARGSR